MFKDKVYEEMDDTEKLFEPFHYKANDLLAKIPDKIEINPADFFKSISWRGYNVFSGDILHTKLQELNIDTHDVNVNDLLYDKFFEFEVEGALDKKPSLNGSTWEMSHNIFLVKTKIGYTEQQLEKLREQRIVNGIRGRIRNNMSKKRMNEVADIYGASKVKQERGWRAKTYEFAEHIKTLLQDKTLDIRDMELCTKFVHWIQAYVVHGNLAALNNLTRLKIITHEKRPIYSIEEKEL